MTPTMIAELARKIVEQQVQQEWWFYLMLLALIFLAAFFGSVVRGYATDVGKFKAIERNYEAVLEQLRKSTSATTQIQLALNHQDWSSREFKTLRREKLEGVVFILYEVREAASKMVTEDADAVTETESTSLNKLVALVGLYFPELTTPILKFAAAKHDFIMARLEKGQPSRRAKSKVAKLEFEITAYFENPSLNSSANIDELQLQLDGARIEYLDIAHEYQLELLKLYRKIHHEFEVAEGEIKSLMGSIISPSI